ncbi:MAG: hypothetical protein JXA60_07015 [Candidatus Coatesbacteria bacterium]|nr:hypothetical protein [Candidatus Coatesbacteria bacterium]
MTDLAIYDDEKRNKLIKKTIRRTLLSFWSFFWLFWGIVFAFVPPFADFWFVPLGLSILIIILRTYKKIQNPEYVGRIVAKQIDIEDTERFNLNQLPTELKKRFRQFRELERKIRKEISQADSYFNPKLMGIAGQVENIILKAYELLKKLHSIKGYLSTTSMRQVQRDIMALKQKLMMTTNPELYQELQRSISLREDNLKQIKHLYAHAEAIEVQLTSVSFSLESTLSRVIKLRVKVKDDVSSGESELTKDIDNLINEMKLFENTMNVLLYNNEEKEQDELYNRISRENLKKE